jgi:hypothetical protein
VKSLTYDKNKVLERLRENRDGHAAKVIEAQSVYQAQVTEELSKRLEQARAGKPVDPSFLAKFPIPQDYTKEYDRVIDRLETTDDKTVTLEDHEFNQWMRDEWDWQGRFTASSSRYLTPGTPVE